MENESTNKTNNKLKRNHWTQANVDNALKKINQEIYERNKCNEIMREKVPKRRKMDVNSEYGMALVKRLKGNSYLQLLTNLVL